MITLVRPSPPEYEENKKVLASVVEKATEIFRKQMFALTMSDGDEE